MIKRPFLAFFSFCLVIFACSSIAVSLMAYAYLKPGPLLEEKMIFIERGSGVSKIASQLKKENIINYDLLFKIAARLSNRHGSLKAGEYEIPAHISMVQLLNLLYEGKVFERKFTIPEGFTSYQIVELLKTNETLKGEIAEIPAEGSLLPETYHYFSGETREEKIKQMQNALQNLLSAIWPDRAENLPFKTKEEAIILASIIEKETGIAGERSKVAGVFINRLNRNIPLQTDPTVIYAITKGKIQNKGKGPLGRRLLKKDLEIDSPYNTYKYPGLPPGPIANPGEESLKAALHPEKHDYIYFVADGSGGHIFAKTLAEHNKNVREWRKIRRTQSAR